VGERGVGSLTEAAYHPRVRSLALASVLVLAPVYQHAQPATKQAPATQQQPKPQQGRADANLEAKQQDRTAKKQPAPATKAPPNKIRSVWAWLADWKRGEVLDFLTLIVTAFFLRFTILTWREMVRANDNTEQSNKENDKHTEESLRLTRESNEETRRAGELHLRAWLVCTMAEHAVDAADDYAITVTVTIRNVGHGVPATEIRSKTVLWVAPTNEPPKEVPDAGHPRNPSLGVAGAGGGIALPVRNAFAVHEAVDIQEGRSFLFAVGEVIYNDHFAKDRVTRFCVKYTPKDPDAMFDGTWSPASSGNEVI
jgi:hypothetical protein